MSEVSEVSACLSEKEGEGKFNQDDVTSYPLQSVTSLKQ